MESGCIRPLVTTMGTMTRTNRALRRVPRSWLSRSAVAPWSMVPARLQVLERPSRARILSIMTPTRFNPNIPHRGFDTGGHADNHAAGLDVSSTTPASGASHPGMGIATVGSGANTAGNGGQFRSAAPVSHQKRRERNATKTIGLEQNRRKLNGADQYSAAHNGLVAGSSPAGPTSKVNFLLRFPFLTKPPGKFSQ